VDRDNRLVSMNFFVDPGKRVYIRRIEFAGNSKTKDEVLRREMRQMEGAWFSQAAIDRSKVRMQRLTYFETVEIETPAVPGTDDQVDVVVTVVELPAGFGGPRLPQVQGLIASLSVQQDNFIGSGKRLGLGVSASSIIKSLNISYDNPYWTDDGISRGFYARYQEFDQGAANISTFTSSEWALGVNFGIPVTEVDYLRSGAGYRNSQLNIGAFTCVEVNPTNPLICDEFALVPSAGDPLSASLDINVDGVIAKDEREFDIFDWTVSWTRDSRNHFLNPSRGSAQSLTLQTAVPGSSREFWKLYYRGAKYWPIWGGLVFGIRGNFGYGDAYDSYDDDILANGAAQGKVPGVDPVQFPVPVGECDPTDAVRLDTACLLRTLLQRRRAGSARLRRQHFGPERLLLPLHRRRPEGGRRPRTGHPTPSSATRARASHSFVDTGYVYENLDAFEANKLRGSFGLSVTWEAPIGPIVISYAFPFNDQPGDRTEDLQFSFGTTF
jgi:outer membrane protein insertion porin family